MSEQAPETRAPGADAEPERVAPRATIEVQRDGPYLVTGAVPVTRLVIATDDEGECVAWEQGEAFPAHASCALCRCGESGLKPYCDGSHLLADFDGAETASTVPYAEAAARIPGSDVDLLDELDLCAEARFCAAKGGLWRRVEADDDESRRVVVEQASLCPSGRYTALEPATGRLVEPELEASIGVVEDPSAGVSGPLWVRGGIPVIGADGRRYEVRNRVTLCRCGHSKNKPFCDSTHVEIGFDDSE